MAPSRHVRKALPGLLGKGGACGLHRQNLTDLGTDPNEIHVDVDSIGENLEENKTLPGDTRAAPPGGVWVAPLGRVWSATLKLGRPMSTTTEGCHGALLRAQDTCVHVMSHLIHSQHGGGAVIVASRKSGRVMQSRNTGIETCCLVERRAPSGKR